MSLINARGDMSVGGCNPRLILFCLLVGEMRGEEFVLRRFLSLDVGEDGNSLW